ncbi:glycosyltransferase family 4 protein [Clostridium niameyense]|uniref:Glycosyltransferase family 4 protein n=1 Tax=Clostridium niameyense TaxID=1622073 RepID=A0A6M0RDM2_9CLOT|nr:glycosyltransferase family 1 protein [Clostridium niameyense]NEZ47388.1 glycosyltransferase family 4 protein [Clostridium niameyense]
MKISIDARGINWYKGTGIGTYTENILKYMINKNSNYFFNIYWAGGNYNNFKKHNTNILLTSKKYSRFFEQCYFPNNINKLKPDIYHIPQNGIGLCENINCKIVVTIHDLIPYIMPETVGKGYLNKFLREMPKIMYLSDKIITVSQHSKNDILKFFPMDEKKVKVIPLAAGKKYKPLEKNKCLNLLKHKYKIDCPFILYIGGFSPRKNVKSLIISFSKIYNKLQNKYKLVIIGAKKDEGNKLLELTNKLKIASNIIFTDFVPEKDLPIFYNACSAFVYPSLYEGFGLPPLEAMSCGAPVITSNTSSIPEVVGDSCITIDPLNTDDMINSLENLLNNEALQRKLSKNGYERSKLFSWEKTSKLTLDLYNELYKN